MSFTVTIGWWLIPVIITLLAGPGDWLAQTANGQYDGTRNWVRSTIILGAWLAWAVVKIIELKWRTS